MYLYTNISQRQTIMTERLTIRNFGPVRDLDIEIKPLTLFIGDQGVGKSTVVKLYTLFRLLERSLTLGRTVKPASFKASYCNYYRLSSFFTENTYMHFVGNGCEFEYKDSAFRIVSKKDDFYDIAKILYVPAERTILSLMDTSAKNVKDLPDMLMAFNEEFEDAKKKLKKSFIMPYDHLSYTYDKQNGISWIVGDEHKTRLTESSSGIQSSVPLCMVSSYLYWLVVSEKERSMSVEEKRRLNDKVAEIMSAGYSESVKEAMLKSLSGYSRYSSFVNIVEELELSLFPKSQVGVLRMLIGFMNGIDGNMLLLTTHSPYLLSALNISILAAKVADVNEDYRKLVDKQVPSLWQLHPEKVAVYALSHDEGSDYCTNAISEKTGMVAANYLDTASTLLSEEFQKVYNLYIQSLRK